MHEDEIDIDMPLVRRLLVEQFPHLADGSIHVLRSTGTVNAIFRLGNDLCIRLPRLEKWSESINREWTWLPQLAPHLSLDIPKPLALGESSSAYPCTWAIYHWIEGTTYRDNLIADEVQAAHDLANFILELRSTDIAPAPRGGRDPIIELDVLTRDAIKSSYAEIDAEAVSAVWAQALQAPP